MRPVILLALAAILLSASVSAGLIQVGPSRVVQTVAEASDIVQDGDIVEIDAGTYTDDISVWRADDVTIRGVGGMAHLQATATIPFTSGVDEENGKGIMVIQGNNYLIENIEFSGSKVPDANGAGIRGDGGGSLTIRNCYFHDNENGFLGAAGTLTIEFSTFENNGIGEVGKTHNMYVLSGTFTLRHSVSKDAHVGHLVKTRAQKNYILYNYLFDGWDASYEIDVPNGGTTWIIGNVIEQGTNNQNRAIVSYGAEGISNPGPQNLYLIHNTIVNDDTAGTFVQNSGGALTQWNNIFHGPGTRPSGYQTNNFDSFLVSNFVDYNNFDYRLSPSSPLRDNGRTILPITGDGFSLLPEYQYAAGTFREIRTTDNIVDPGAWEVNGGSVECTAGQTSSCGTDVGACQSGTESCFYSEWSGICTGEIQPITEVCGDGQDNDCDGQTDEGCGGGCEPADITLDGGVGASDLIALALDYGSPSPANPRSDINGDGNVDVQDVLALAQKWGVASGC